ncbi:MAG: GTP-binding protein [Cyanothece sp. SIO1E1]|nr:GTP-binding protein [Cyanothece sp. SIO1E1]
MLVLSNKICVLGDFAVGKTSLIRRFVECKFSEQYLSTVGVKVSRKNIELDDLDAQATHPLQLLFWDIEGGAMIEKPSAYYFHEAVGAIIVADITRPQTIQHIPNYIDLFSCFNPKGSIVVVLNKVDLIEKEDLEHLSSSICFAQNNRVLKVCSTSAKTGENVEAAFTTLAAHFVSLREAVEG